MNLVVDSSILIDHLRGGSAWKRVLSQGEEDLRLFVPTIVIFELFAGQSSRDPAIVFRIRQLIHNFQRIELDEKIAKIAGELFRDFGKHIQIQDYIIAASALSINAQVVTLNRKHFEKIPGITLYDFGLEK